MEYLARINLEHQGISQLLQVQRDLLERLKKAKGVNIVHLANLLVFWRDFLEQEHLSWEEEFAFAALRKLNHSLPERLQGEHDRIRTQLARLEATMKQLRSGQPHSSREYVKWGEELVKTVGDHIAGENAAFQELSVSGLAAEIVFSRPAGADREKVNRLVPMAEELCREYLQQETALRPLQGETQPGEAPTGPVREEREAGAVLSAESLDEGAGPVLGDDGGERLPGGA